MLRAGPNKTNARSVSVPAYSRGNFEPLIGVGGYRSSLGSLGREFDAGRQTARVWEVVFGAAASARATLSQRLLVCPRAPSTRARSTRGGGQPGKPIVTIPQAKFLASVRTRADDVMSSEKRKRSKAPQKRSGLATIIVIHLRQPAWVEAAFRDLPVRRSRSSGYIKRAVTCRGRYCSTQLVSRFIHTQMKPTLAQTPCYGRVSKRGVRMSTYRESSIFRICLSGLCVFPPLPS